MFAPNSELCVRKRVIGEVQARATASFLQRCLKVHVYKWHLIVPEWAVLSLVQSWQSDTLEICYNLKPFYVLTLVLEVSLVKNTASWTHSSSLLLYSFNFTIIWEFLTTEEELLWYLNPLFKNSRTRVVLVFIFHESCLTLGDLGNKHYSVKVVIVWLEFRFIYLVYVKIILNGEGQSRKLEWEVFWQFRG